MAVSRVMQLSPKGFHDQSCQGIRPSIRRQSLVESNSTMPSKFRNRQVKGTSGRRDIGIWRETEVPFTAVRYAEAGSYIWDPRAKGPIRAQ